jgi:hypothetical protein
VLQQALGNNELLDALNRTKICKNTRKKFQSSQSDWLMKRNKKERKGTYNFRLVCISVLLREWNESSWWKHERHEGTFQ